MKMTYLEQLKHPNWQRVRLERLTAANWECEECGGKENTLHVHHKQYFKGRMAWEYEQHELSVLCEGCHKTAHSIDESIKSILANVSSFEALGLLAGYFSEADVDESLITEGFQCNPYAYTSGLIAQIANYLSLEKQHETIKLASSLTRQDSEARKILEKNEYLFLQSID